MQLFKFNKNTAMVPCTQRNLLRLLLLMVLTTCPGLQATFAQSGKVGIGTTTPSSLLHLRSVTPGDTSGIRLHILGVQNSYIYNTGSDMILRNALNINQLVLDQNGNIGLGTDVPAAKLHILNNNQALRLDGTNPALAFYDGATQKGYLLHSGSNLTLYNALAGSVLFATNGNTKMLIDSSGRVGIGLPAPNAKLHVRQNGLAVRIDGNSASLGFFQDSTQKGSVGHSGNEMYILNTTDDKLHLGTNNSTDLTIASNGNIGIGISDPIDDLHVKGVTGYLRLDGQDPGLTFFNETDWLGSIQTLNDNLRIQNRKPGKTFLGNNGNIQFTLNTDGQVGLGTQFPEARLHLSSPLEDAISGIRLSALNYTQNSVIYNKNGNMYLGIQGVDKQLVLTPGGGVGIGTDIPDALLHVKSGTSSYAGIFQNSASTGTWLGIGNVGTGGKFFQFISSGSGNTGGAGNLLIYSGADWDQASTLAMAINDDGRIAIGGVAFSTGYDLSVNGKIISEGLRVQAIASWPDYVFEPDYNRPALSEVEAFIDTHGHLPGFDPASVVETQGLDMEVITVQQQEWIEVSTLYILEQEKRIVQLERQVGQQSQRISLLLNLLENK